MREPERLAYLYDTAEMTKIRANVISGQLLVGGTSAGLEVQQNLDMLLGGESYEALAKPVLDHVCTDKDCGDQLQYDKNGGLGLFTVGVLDAHFG